MSSWFASLIKFTGGVQARLPRKSQVARGKVLQTDYHALVLQTYHNTLVFVSPKAVKVFNFSFQASKLWPSCDPGTSKQWFLPHSSKWIPISWGILVYIMFLLNDDWFQIFELKFLFCSCHGRQHEMFTFSLAYLPKTTTDVYIWSLTELRSHKWFLCGRQDMFTFDCLTKLWSHKYFYVDSKICLRLIFWQNYCHILLCGQQEIFTFDLLTELWPHKWLLCGQHPGRIWKCDRDCSQVWNGPVKGEHLVLECCKNSKTLVPGRPSAGWA